MDNIDIKILSCLKENARINTSVIGERINMSVSAVPKFNEKFTESINNNPQIIECHYITGDFDFLLKVITDSAASLSDVLNEIKSISGVSLTRTLIVLSTSKSEVSVLPESIDA